MNIKFETEPYRIKTWTIVVLPKTESEKLSSRGMNMADAIIEGEKFRVPLEPDSRGSHWFRIEDSILKKTSIKAGDVVPVEIEIVKDWSKPELPDDLAKALKSHAAASTLWEKITPKAQWEWVRWIRSTKQAETRARRIEVACSKLTSGMRRPCCFNSSVCTEPYVSDKWILIPPAGV